MAKGMIIAGIAASEAIDSSNEILKIDGVDLTDFYNGTAQLNYEHLGEGKTPPGQELVGRVIFAKKIFNEEDCDTDQQLDFFKKINKLPYIYVQARLYDAAGHPGAQALAAQIRDHHANGEKILCRFSIEGSTLERDKENDKIITSSIAKRLALTTKPCNKSCDVVLVADPNAPVGFEDPSSKQPEKSALSIFKAESDNYIQKGVEAYYDPFVKEAVPKKLRKNSEDEISQQLKHPDYSVREAAVRHPNATSEHINQGLKDEHFFVREAAVRHPNATPEHLTQGLNDEDWSVRARAAAVSHPKATLEHLTQGLKDNHPYVRAAAVSHPNATTEHINQGLKDDSPDVRIAAVGHPKATLEHLTQGLKDKFPYVRAAALSHPNATPEHITQGLKDKTPDVRYAAVKHPKATVEQLTQGLRDNDPYVRAAAINHPKATPEHIIQGLNDEDSSVRYAAEQALVSKDLNLNYEQLKALPPKLRNQLFKRKPHSKQFFEQEQRKEQEYAKEQKRQQKLDQTSRWSQLEVDDKDQLPKLTQTLTSRPIQNRNIFQRLREIHEENKRQQKLKPSRTSLLEVDDSEPTDLPKDPDEFKRFSLLELSEKELFKQKLKKALEAGFASSAPGSRVQGATLQKEDLKTKVSKFVASFKKKKKKKKLQKSKEMENLELFCKAENLCFELKKAEQELAKSKSFTFRGTSVSPGLAEGKSDKYWIVHEDKDHYLALPHSVKEFAPEQLVKLLKSKENTHYRVKSRPVVGSGLRKNSEDEISQQLKHPDYSVREAAVRHPNATSEHINQGLKDEHFFVRKAAVRHPNATVEHISQGLNDEHSFVREAAIKHPKATPEHITQGLNDKNEYVRIAAIKHPKATPEHITQGLKDTNTGVREAAVRHPKATLEHLTQGLKDKHYYVRAAALKHPNATPEHITQGLKDERYYVRAAALKHPNATVEHITQGLNDEDFFVREAAQQALASKDLNYEQLKALPIKLRNQVFERRPHSKQFFEQEKLKEKSAAKEQKRQQKLDQTSRWSQLEVKDPRRKKVKLPEEPGPSRTSLLEVDDSEPTDLPKDPDEFKRFSLLELSEKELFKQKLKKAIITKVKNNAK